MVLELVTRKEKVLLRKIIKFSVTDFYFLVTYFGFGSEIFLALICSTLDSKLMPQGSLLIIYMHLCLSCFSPAWG